MTDLTITPGRLRVGDAERERVTDQLAEHHAAGRLTMTELDERLTATLTARTRDELAAAVADLPAVPPTPAEPRRGLPSPGGPVWRSQLLGYVVVIAALWLIWALTGAGHPWPIWPMLGWGLGLLGHRGQRGLRGQLGRCGALRPSARG